MVTAANMAAVTFLLFRNKNFLFSTDYQHFISYYIPIVYVFWNRFHFSP